MKDGTDRHPMRVVDRWTTAGLFGGLLLAAVSLGARLVLPWPSYFDLAGEHLVAATPGAAFDSLLQRLQHWGKPVLLLGLVFLSLLILTLAASAYGRILHSRPGGGARWLAAGTLALALWAVSGWLVGAFAQPFPSNLQISGAALPGFTVFAIALAAMGAEPKPLRQHSTDTSRRRLVTGLTGLAVIANAGILSRLITQMLELPASGGRSPGRAAAPAESGSDAGASATATEPELFESLPGLQPRLTDNDVFYRVSKNFVDPNVALDGWSLEVFGLIEQPQRLSYEQVRAMPVVDETVTLECVSNLVGGPLVGNAVWTGVPLSTILRAAQVKPEARFVIFTCSDNYNESYPLDKALAASTILAHTMNGQPLPRRHGFPLRVISTGRYGMKNPKWLRKIELTTDPLEGWWERQGWDSDAVVQTMSRIDVPAAGVTLPASKAVLGGIAFAGERGISSVELSADGGTSWQAARLDQPATAGAWTRWLWPWPNVAPGSYRVQVRATDGGGTVQSPARQGSLPTGATGYDEVAVRLA